MVPLLIYLQANNNNHLIQNLYILNSQDISPFWLLSSFKHATLSVSTPLFTTSSFTTCSTLQLLVLLEYVSAPFLSVTLSTLFMNFIKTTIFLYLAGVDNKDNDIKSTTKPNIQYEFQSLHASPFWFLPILKHTTPSISIPLCTTSSTLHLLALLEFTVPSLPLSSWTFFVILSLSPVSDSDNQGKVGDLYHL